MTWYSMERGWMDDRLWRNDVYSKREAWCWLIENAAYEPEKTFVNGKSSIIKRGDVIQTHRQLADIWKWGRQKVRTFLDHLKLDEKLTISVTQGITTISIVNYDTYQKQQPEDNPENNQEITKEQPRSNPLKKELNNKTTKKTKGKKILCPEYWQPSDDVFIWATKHGLSNFEVDGEIEKFVAYFTEGNGEGTKRPGWEASFKAWIRNNNNYSSEEIKFKSKKQEDAENLDRYLEYYKKNNHWIMEWGFGPDDFRCTIPHEILARHDIPPPPATK